MKIRFLGILYDECKSCIGEPTDGKPRESNIFYRLQCTLDLVTLFDFEKNVTKLDRITKVMIFCSKLKNVVFFAEFNVTKQRLHCISITDQKAEIS